MQGLFHLLIFEALDLQQLQTFSLDTIELLLVELALTLELLHILLQALVLLLHPPFLVLQSLMIDLELVKQLLEVLITRIPLSQLSLGVLGNIEGTDDSR